MLAWLRAITRRITPTCVGRTTRGTRTGRSSADHPHVRGEDVYTSDNGATVIGSPPRAWGGPGTSSRPVSSKWITPTCVGRTGTRRALASTPPDHPHVRGEDLR